LVFERLERAGLLAKIGGDMIFDDREDAKPISQAFQPSLLNALDIGRRLQPIKSPLLWLALISSRQSSIQSLAVRLSARLSCAREAEQGPFTIIRRVPI